MSKSTPVKTKLAQKYEQEEADAYVRIQKAIDNAAKLLAMQLAELKGKDGKTLTKVEKNNYHRELVKHAKLAVKQIEPTNRLHIFIFKSATGEWWKLGGNSVAIHRLMIATYLDREVNINVDRDNFSIFREGVVCLQDGLRLEKDIAYAGAPLVLDPKVELGPFKEVIKAYRLNKPLQEREIRQFKKLDMELLKTINNNIFATAPDTEINNHMVVALRESYKLERQMDANARSFVGHPLMDSMFRIRREYYDVANLSRKDAERYVAMKRMDGQVGDAMAVLANYADLGIVNRNMIARTSLELAKTRELLRQKINQHHHKHEVGEMIKVLETEGE